MADEVDLQQLESIVARMRALGVLRLRSVSLGLEIDLADEPSALPATTAPAALGDDEDDGWPGDTGNVYTSPFSYPHGVPHLVRDPNYGKK